MKEDEKTEEEKIEEHYRNDKDWLITIGAMYEYFKISMATTPNAMALEVIHQHQKS